MIAVRKSNERGRSEYGWLDSWHTFSFADYFDPKHVSYSSLRVLNEDRIAPGGGFPAHGHRDMEIITYVLEGALRHQDSMGNGSVIEPGDVQRMSAGTGVVHSEFNASQDAPVHLLQIWILPNQTGLEPGYEQRHFDPTELRGRLRLVASPNGREGSVKIHQDASVFVTRMAPEDSLRHALGKNRKVYVQVAAGRVSIDGHTLEAGDGAQIYDEPAVRLDASEPAEVILFDLP